MKSPLSVPLCRTANSGFSSKNATLAELAKQGTAETVGAHSHIGATQQLFKRYAVACGHDSPNVVVSCILYQDPVLNECHDVFKDLFVATETRMQIAPYQLCQELQRKARSTTRSTICLRLV